MSRTVTVYVDRNMLRPLIIMLNNFRGLGSPYPIPEIVYLNQMSKSGSLPGEKFYPRAIIKHMLERHEKVMDLVWIEPSLAQRFQCRYYEEGRRRVYEFSNTMPFYADVITLIFLYQFYNSYGNFPPRTNELVMLMFLKYIIREPVNYDESYETDPTKITLWRVHQCFYSVTLWMCNYMPALTLFVRTVFPRSSLPAMVGAPSFSLILLRPGRGLRSSYNYLLMVNLALCVVYARPTPVMSLVRHQKECCTWSSVYTEDMRIYICTKLGIVMNRNDEYVFTPNFEKRCDHYEIARNKIWGDRFVQNANGAPRPNP